MVDFDKKIFRPEWNKRWTYSVGVIFHFLEDLSEIVKLALQKGELSNIDTCYRTITSNVQVRLWEIPKHRCSYFFKLLINEEYFS